MITGIILLVMTFNLIGYKLTYANGLYKKEELKMINGKANGILWFTLLCAVIMVSKVFLPLIVKNNIVSFIFLALIVVMSILSFYYVICWISGRLMPTMVTFFTEDGYKEASLEED